MELERERPRSDNVPENGASIRGAAWPSEGRRPLLTVSNIQVAYEQVILAVSDVSLEVPVGGIVALLGANGAGKTTTLKAISNLIRAERGEVTAGTIVFDGAEVQRLRPNEMVRRGCIQVMEGRRCFPHLTVRENLLTGAFARADGRREIQRDLERMFVHFPRLRERANSTAGYLSGGEQQMCALARALMSSPRLVLLDEPSMGLAPLVVEQIFGIIRDLNRQEGVTFLLAEQNTSIALRYADHGYVLDNGRISLHGDAAALATTDKIREAYLGLVTPDGKASIRP